MVRFSPNLYHLFLELPITERFSAAAKMGFTSIEWHFPYELSKGELKSRLADNCLQFQYAVMPVDWSKVKGLAGLPGREAEFKKAAEAGLEYLAHVGCKFMQVGAGVVPDGVDRASCVATFEQNLTWVCAQAQDAGVTIAIEGVSNARFPGWVIQTIAQTAEVVRAVDHPYLKLVYDTFHLRMEERGPLTPLIDDYWPLIGYVQIGNAPTRHEPGFGEIDLFHVIDAFRNRGWEEPIGLEFDPKFDTWTSLAWARRYGYTEAQPPDGIAKGVPTARGSI